MTRLTFGSLKTRETPTQERAVRRVHAILQATADVLGDRPPQELTTSAIAVQAGIPVSSIYRYFPTLEDLMEELYRQTAEELRTKLFAIFEDELTYPTWRERLVAALKTQRSYLSRHPYYRPLLLLFAVNRGPLAVADEEHDDLVQFLQRRWARGKDGFRDGDPLVVANTTIQIAIAMEDLVAAQKGRDASRPYSDELVTLLQAYLSRYLND